MNDLMTQWQNQGTETKQPPKMKPNGIVLKSELEEKETVEFKENASGKLYLGSIKFKADKGITNEWLIDKLKKVSQLRTIMNELEKNKNGGN
ncbi:MAG TPA: hypothetical protein ENH95_02785 [Nitrosopumilus sp.]|nr:hypothetical protein [Nitrosopumilus sp.]